MLPDTSLKSRGTLLLPFFPSICTAVGGSAVSYTSHRCIRGLLADRLVVLVTHQVQFALQADKILALKDVSSQPSLQQLVSHTMSPMRSCDTLSGSHSVSHELMLDIT